MMLMKIKHRVQLNLKIGRVLRLKLLQRRLRLKLQRRLRLKLQRRLRLKLLRV